MGAGGEGKVNKSIGRRGARREERREDREENGLGRR